MTPPRTSPADTNGPDAGRPPRADARRNRVRVLAAAEAVFAAKGTSASTEEVAREAGVGIGTVFRHFPTKEALLEAVFVGHVRRLVEGADALLAADDPGAALFTFFRRVVDMAATKKAFTEALAEVGVDVQTTVSRDGGEDLQRVVGLLLTRAQQAGAVRDDVGVSDLIALFVGASGAAEHAGWDREVKERTLAVVFDGLRQAGGR